MGVRLSPQPVVRRREFETSDGGGEGCDGWEVAGLTEISRFGGADVIVLEILDSFLALTLPTASTCCTLAQ